ncbi:MAG: lactonase family protein [Gemmataceae bacterium]
MRFLLGLLLLPAFQTSTPAETIVYVSVAGAKKIAAYGMNPRAGTLTLRSSTACEGEPGALTVDPARRFLFAALRSTGQLSAFSLDRATGKLTHLNTVPAGADPAHISTDRAGRFLFTAYYVAAKVTVHAIRKDGSISDKPLQVIDTAEKAHAILSDPSNRFVYVPHTGPDAIFQFTFDARTGRLASGRVARLATPKNSGPRHIVFHPRKDVVYIDNEQGSSVTAYALDTKAGGLEPIQTAATLPKDFMGVNATAEIRIHPTGRFLYVSNRGHDSIACFTLDEDGKLTSTGQAATEKTPRSFDLDPAGRFLYAAGESSGALATYRVDAKTGALSRLTTMEVGAQPWWVMAVELPAE